MKVKMLTDKSDGKGGFYAKAGDEVMLIEDSHHPILILCTKAGNRFPCHINQTNLSIVSAPEQKTSP